MDTTADLENLQAEEQVELTANDRCDACGSQAYVQVFINDASLLFCAHHYNKNEEAIKPTAKYVYDRRDMLFNQQNRQAPEDVE
jgi:hypothetical protein